MSDELREFLDSLKGQEDDSGLLEMLISETIRWRDELKEQSGEILTVGDTRLALDALENHVQGEKLVGGLSESQRQLLDRWLSRLKEIQAERDASDDDAS